MKSKKILFISLMLLAITGCSSANKKIDQNDYQERNLSFSQVTSIDRKNAEFLNVYDPLEPLNRRIYYFNYYLDKYVLIPAVNTYDFITPTPVQTGVSNFFSNFQNVSTFLNSVLQFKLGKALVTAVRFGVNTTVGVLGLFDVATAIGLPKTYEDFGLTMAYYGVGDGPYLVLPGFGPSNLRDATGKLVGTISTGKMDIYHPVDFQVNSPTGTTLYAIDTRKKTESFRYYGTGSPFEYEYVRFFYTTYRDILEKGNTDTKEE
ncbi:MlaA family lipoprotein [Cetobacterium sp. SF1]|uniref:MlaA family lipoprotein n=1 Tax=unclassified Cetobacterium TaxID=2630983 RepID=UPI003CFB2DF2